MTKQEQQQRILLPDQPVTSLDEYRKLGGLEAYEKARKSGPEDVISALRGANLRGRGGAGFPTAIKWSGVRNSEASRRYICCNAAEGEPGTFKDRWLMRHNPYQLLEGLAIGMQVIGAQAGYICLKRNFKPETEALRRAMDELRPELPPVEDMELVLGPDEYLFGEEKAMLEVIEGGLPLPRVFPPYVHGLFGGTYGGPSDRQNNPTVVNNVETLSHVPHIINRGADWFRSFGTDETPGTMVFTVSGDVQRPLVRELPLGLTLRELVFDIAGGPAEGRKVKAVFPGVANAVITGDMLETPLGFDSMKKAGSALGSAGFVVYDDTACMVQVAHEFSRFLYVESCNQCPPCKIGSRRITERLERFLNGGSTPQDIDDIWETTTWVENNQRCYLATSEAVVMYSVVHAFRDEFMEHVNDTCDRRHDIVIPKMTDYAEGKGFTYDLRYSRKQPDWSYDSD